MSVAKAEPLEKCRICGCSDLRVYLDLGEHPASNSFIYPSSIPDERTFPLRVALCQECGLSQLDTIVSVEEIFDDYAYRSSTSRALLASFAELASRIDLLNLSGSRKPLVVDIGCNDGYLLKQFDPQHYETLGVEPSSAAHDAIKNGFRVEKVFFGIETARDLRNKYGAADFIVVTNVLAHVPDIRSFAEGISHWLSQDGTFVVEFPYVLDMVRNRWFDTVYHEHLSYLAITPLQLLFASCGLRIFDIEKCEVGGSGPFLRVFIQKIDPRSSHESFPVVEKYLSDEQIFGIKILDSYINFSREVERIKDVLLLKIDSWLKQGLIVGGYGAPAKGNTLLNYLGLNQNQLKAVADNTPEKLGRVTPGTHIPVIGDLEFLDQGFRHALLLSWNYLDYFKKHSAFIKTGGQFLVPFPIPRIVKFEKEPDN